MTTAKYTMPLPGGVLGDVRQPQPVRFGGRELSVDQISRHLPDASAAPIGGLSAGYAC